MDGLASQAKHCARPFPLESKWHLLPRYVQLELIRHVLCNIARFRLRAHTLRVETRCWQIHNGL